MLSLTRQTRFAIPTGLPAPASDGLPGSAIDGPSMYLCLDVTLAGPLDTNSNYIQNIRNIDDRVRAQVIPALSALIGAKLFTGARAVSAATSALSGAWNAASLLSLRLTFNPTLWWEAHIKELPMVRLTQRFEFSAAHRLHNPALDDQANRQTFGKCNNPDGHGHNYELEVTLQGPPDPSGQLICLNTFQSIVNQSVIDRLDHKHLNLQVPEFAQKIPTVENIAAVIFGLLENRFPAPAQLQSVRVWETPKTFAEFSR